MRLFPSRLSGFLLLGLIIGLSPWLATASSQFSPETASFSIKVNGMAIPYRVFASFFLPGQQVSLSLTEVGKQLPLRMESEGGAQRPTGPLSWSWEAPAKPGLYPLRFVRSDTGETLVINAFVMRPFSEVKNGYLNGYHIGHYPVPFNHSYQLPRGFIEVTRETENTLVSPHFRLKQFLCKQAGSYPKYVVLREPLIQKLERTLAAVNRDGYTYSGFHIMSGYRTPAYNQSLGNVKFSRHLLGEAADILMDGAVGRKPIAAGTFFKLVDESQRLATGGGLGRYTSNSHHGPFVHVDVRPGLARWQG